MEEGEVREPSMVTDGWPTHPLGWIASLFLRRLREGLMKCLAGTGRDTGPEDWSILAQLWRLGPSDARGPVVWQGLPEGLRKYERVKQKRLGV